MVKNLPANAGGAGDARVQSLSREDSVEESLGLEDSLEEEIYGL